MTLTIDTASIQASVTERVVGQVTDEFDFVGEIRKAIAARVDALFDATAQDEITKVVSGLVESGFDREYQKIDTFGRPKGEPTSIRVELERTISNYWTTKVDSNGKPSTDTYHSTPRAEWMMLQICGKEFHEQMKPTIISGAAWLKDGMRRELRTACDRMLGDLFNVRSTDDQAEGRYK